MIALLRRSLVPVALALALFGCNFNLDEPTLVKTPRILAIVADRPEAAPGQDVHVRVLAVDPIEHRELHYAFEVCFDSSTILGAASSNGTGGMAPQTPPCIPMASTGEEALLPGAMSAQLLTFIDSLPPSSGIDPMLLRNVLATAGLPITVRVEVSATDGAGQEVVLVTGTKLVGITTRETPTTNPPFVYFDMDHERVETDGSVTHERFSYLGGTDRDHPFDCVPWLTPAASFVASDPDVHAGLDAVTLSPADDPTSWEESFPIYDFSGMVRTGYEGAYYSWYSTASWTDDKGVVHSVLHAETTQGPAHGAEPSAIDDTIRDNTWDVPREPGTYDLWVVVRDGHLGTAACHTTIEVTPRP